MQFTPTRSGVPALPMLVLPTFHEFLRLQLETTTTFPQELAALESNPVAELAHAALAALSCLGVP